MSGDNIFTRFEATRLRCMQAVTKSDFYTADRELQKLVELRGLAMNNLNNDFTQCHDEVTALKMRIRERSGCPDCEI